jgi:hypothetical protein
MPTLDTANPGNSNQGPPDDTSSGTIDVPGINTGSDDSGVVIVGQGNGISAYDYDIINLYGGVGNAYIALNGSNITSNSSVAVFNRNNAFVAINSSIAYLSNCCSYAANQGFVAWDTSKLFASTCVSSIAGSNYWTSNSSSITVDTCASVFPVNTGVNVSANSAFNSRQFETMTTVWGNAGAGIPVSIHYSSRNNSWCGNNSINIASKSSLGLSGPVLSGAPISFIWSQISNNPAYAPLTGMTNPFEDRSASYRFVPRNHSNDYNILTNGNDLTAAGTSLRVDAVVVMLSQQRDCYASVKPPAYLHKPEDFSGSTAFGSAFQNLSLSNVLSSLV